MTTAQMTPPAEARQEEKSSKAHYVPHTDIVETNGDLEVRVDLPGARPESIDVSFDDGKLTITAEVEERHPKNGSFLLREYGVGNFHRVFRVANTYDRNRVDASYRDGVLVLAIPKAAEEKPRRIEVKASV